MDKLARSFFLSLLHTDFSNGGRYPQNRREARILTRFLRNEICRDFEKCCDGFIYDCFDTWGKVFGGWQLVANNLFGDPSSELCCSDSYNDSSIALRTLSVQVNLYVYGIVLKMTNVPEKTVICPASQGDLKNMEGATILGDSKCAVKGSIVICPPPPSIPGTPPGGMVAVPFRPGDIAVLILTAAKTFGPGGRAFRIARTWARRFPKGSIAFAFDDDGTVIHRFRPVDMDLIPIPCVSNSELYDVTCNGYFSHTYTGPLGLRLMLQSQPTTRWFMIVDDDSYTKLDLTVAPWWSNCGGSGVYTEKH